MSARLLPAALYEREYRLLFLGQVFSLIGSSMVPLALSFAVLNDLNGSATDVGLVLMAYEIPLVGFVLFGGVVGDRFSRRSIMFGADVVRGLGQASLAFLLISGNATLWQLAILFGITGAGSAFFSPACTGLIPQTVSAHNLQQANALRGLSDSVAVIAGPAIAGVLVATVGAGWAIAVDALTYAWSTAFIMRLRVGLAERAPRESVIGDLMHGWREFRSRTWLWVVVTQFGLLHMFSLAPLLVLGVVVADKSLGGSSAWGLILSANAIGALIGGFVALRLRVSRPLRTATLCIFPLALPLASLAIPATIPVVATANFAAGIGIAVFGTLWDTTLQREVPAEVLSRVSAWDWFGSLALLPIGMAIAGPIADLIGVSTTLWIAASFTVVSASTLLAVPSVTRLRSRPLSLLDASSDRVGLPG